MDKTFFDWMVSAVVLAVAALFAWFAYSTTHTGTFRGYDVVARFHSVAGVEIGNDVKISGIKVGTISAMEVTPDTFDAKLTLSLDPAIKLPADSSVRVASEGLLGGTILVIEPGKDRKTIAPGGEITDTVSPDDMVQLIGRKIFGSDNGQR